MENYPYTPESLEPVEDDIGFADPATLSQMIEEEKRRERAAASPAAVPSAAAPAKKRLTDISPGDSKYLQGVKKTLSGFEDEIAPTPAELEATDGIKGTETDITGLRERLEGTSGKVAKAGDQYVLNQAVSQIAQGIIKAFAASQGARDVNIKGLDWDKVYAADIKGIESEREGIREELAGKRDLLSRYLSTAEREKASRTDAARRREQWIADELLRAKEKEMILGEREKMKAEAKAAAKDEKLNYLMQSIKMQAAEGAKEIEKERALTTKFSPMIAKVETKKEGLAGLAATQGFANFEEAEANGYNSYLLAAAVHNKVKDRETHVEAKNKIAQLIGEGQKVGSLNPQVIEINNQLDKLPGKVDTSLDIGKIRITPVDESELLRRLMSSNSENGKQARMTLTSIGKERQYLGIVGQDAATEAANKLLAGRPVTPDEMNALREKGVEAFALAGIKEDNAVGKALKAGAKGKQVLKADISDIDDETKDSLRLLYPSSAIIYGAKQ